MPVRGTDFHLFKRVTYIGVAHFIKPDRVGIVGLDRHKSYSAIAIIRCQLLNSALIELRRGTVIADECDDQHLACGIVFQAMGLIIRSG